MKKKIKTKGWTPQQREKQAEICRKTRPSAHATGAKTAEGKQKSAQNARKHGGFSRDIKRLESLIRKQRKVLRDYILNS